MIRAANDPCDCGPQPAPRDCECSWSSCEPTFYTVDITGYVPIVLPAGHPFIEYVLKDGLLTSFDDR